MVYNRFAAIEQGTNRFPPSVREAQAQSDENTNAIENVIDPQINTINGRVDDAILSIGQLRGDVYGRGATLPTTNLFDGRQWQDNYGTIFTYSGGTWKVSGGVLPTFLGTIPFSVPPANYSNISNASGQFMTRPGLRKDPPFAHRFVAPFKGYYDAGVFLRTSMGSGHLGSVGFRHYAQGTGSPTSVSQFGEITTSGGATGFSLQGQWVFPMEAQDEIELYQYNSITNNQQYGRMWFRMLFGT